MIDTSVEKIRKMAEYELRQEAERQAIDKMKEKLKARKWWHKIWPYKILIIRRD